MWDLNTYVSDNLMEEAVSPEKWAVMSISIDDLFSNLVDTSDFELRELDAWVTTMVVSGSPLPSIFARNTASGKLQLLSNHFMVNVLFHLWSRKHAFYPTDKIEYCLSRMLNIIVFNSDVPREAVIGVTSFNGSDFIANGISDSDVPEFK